MLKKQILTINLLLALATGYTYAQSTGTKNQGYLLDNVGNSAVIQAPTSGVCVRTTEWTPARAIAECDPELVSKPAPKPTAVAPKPTVVAPAPAPKPAPPKPVIQKFTLAADALFDFDKSVIKPAGMAKLDELAATLKGAQYDTITTIGHTDRLGGVEYNQRLSHRRAEAVRAYLVGKGLDGARISAVGKGKTQPITKPGDCKAKARATLHACLQPDRRVEVEATGSKTVAAPAVPASKPATKPTATKSAK